MKQFKELDQQLAISRKFCTDLCWLLLAEEQESALVEFLMNEATIISRQPQFDMKQQYHDKGATGHRMRRNHNLTSGLIDAHISLSTDGTAKDGLECLLAMSRAAREKDIFYALDWVGSTIIISNHLVRTECAPCDKELFDQFCNFMRTIMNTANFDRNIAFVILYHPTSPHASAALQLLKNQLQGLLTHRKTRLSKEFYGRMLLRATFIQYLQDPKFKTQRARNVLQKKFGSLGNCATASLILFRKTPSSNVSRASRRLPTLLLKTTEIMVS